MPAAADAEGEDVTGGREIRRWSAAALAALGMALPVLASGLAVARNKSVCDELSYLFYVLAEYEARGDAKATQLAWVRESFADDEHEELLERALDYIYASDEAPMQLYADDQRSCTVDEQGRAVIRLPGL